jgi:hypothetical protein
MRWSLIRPVKYTLLQSSIFAEIFWVNDLMAIIVIACWRFGKPFEDCRMAQQ